MLFPIPARGMREEREESRVSLNERCEKAAELASSNGSAVLWCHLNHEGDLLEKLIPDCLQVSGSMSDDKKEERLLAFQSGQLRRLVTKRRSAFGLNWQHSQRGDVSITFVEQYYQAVRCWRFGQESLTCISRNRGSAGVLRNFSKSEQADRMFSAISQNANASLKIERRIEATNKENLPSWL
jgi:hypothetical protein